jgi:hypothetical protein
MPVIAPSAARRQVKKINPDLLPTKVVCPLPPLPAMPPPPPLISEYAPRPTRAAGVRKSPSTEKLMAVWWQAKIDSVARAPLHQTAADDALQPRPPTGNAAVPRSTRDLLPSIKWGSEVNSRTENVAHGYQGPHNELLQQEAAALSVSHQPRQLGDAGGDAPGVVSGEELRGPGVPEFTATRCDHRFRLGQQLARPGSWRGQAGNFSKFRTSASPGPSRAGISHDYAYVIAEGRLFSEGPPATLAAMPEIRRAYLGL